MEEQVDATIGSRSVYSTATRTFRHEYLLEQSSTAAAPRISRRASLLLALTLSLGLWAAIWAAIASMISAVRG